LILAFASFTYSDSFSMPVTSSHPASNPPIISEPEPLNGTSKRRGALSRAGGNINVPDSG